MLISAILLTVISMNAQNKKEQALAKGQEAVELMDNGRFDESIKLLEQAQKLDPDRFDYPYELALAHYLKEDYKTAIKILEKNKNHPDVTDRLFQLLGNSYDYSGQEQKAFDAYDEGLQRFPKSGMMYLEKGNIHWGKEEYGEALPYYEKGIEIDPAFSSNYYRAARIYCSSTEPLWGILYGEIFLNLERGSTRTEEMSKLLYDTYKENIKFKSDTSYSVSFCGNTITMGSQGEMKLPFGLMVYEPLMLIAIVGEKTIDMNALCNIRSRFLDLYFQNDNSSKYPNALFDYQKKVKEAGHLDAYNHWILLKGDENAFDKWYDKNKTAWDDFIKWFTDYGMVVDEGHRFYSGQY